MVKPVYLDKDGKVLPETASAEEIALSVYEIPIKKGILFAPHPAFAKNEKGEYVNHALAPEVIDQLHNPMDLPQKGTREPVSYTHLDVYKRQVQSRKPAFI